MRVEQEAFKKLKRRHKMLVDAFEPFRIKGADIQAQLCPWRGRNLGGKTSEEDRGAAYDDSSILNTHPTICSQTAAAGIKSGISPASRPWFRIEAEDKRAAEFAAPGNWLSGLERLFYSIFQRSNVYDGLHHVYQEIIDFGTGTSLVLPDPETVTHLRTLTYGEYQIGHNSKGETDTLARTFYKTAIQLKEQFGEDNLSQRTKDLIENSPDTRVLVNFLMEPNDDRYDIKDAMGRDTRVIYWEDGVSEDDLVLGVRGFDIFAAISGAWEKVGNQDYGFGLGHFNLRNCKRLQRMEEDKLQQLAQITKPPLLSNISNKDEIVNTSPWGLTYDHSIGTGARPGIVPLYQVTPNTQHIEVAIGNVEQAIFKGFFNDVFMMISNSADDIKTAYQTARMMEEKYSALGPVIERLQTMLGQLIQITYQYAQDYELIPPPPPELEGQDIKIEYVSILAQAQKIAGLQAIEQTVQFAGAAAPIWPEARHKIDILQAIDEVASVNGTPPSMIRPDDEVDDLVEQEAQMAQAKQAMEQASVGARAAKDLNDVQVGGRSAVDVLSGAMPNGPAE